MTEQILDRQTSQAADTPLETGPETAAPAKAEHRVRCIYSLVQQAGKFLAVARRGPHGEPHWELPAALTAEGEQEEATQARGLMECAGLNTGARTRIYEGPNSTVYAVAAVEPGVARKRLTCAWLTAEQIVANSARGALMTAVFGAFETAGVNQSNVISKTKDGRTLYSVVYDANDGPGTPLRRREPHYLHALNGEDAAKQFSEMIPHDRGLTVNVIGVAPAIGFFQEEDGSLRG
jgi:hypothetical protein